MLHCCLISIRLSNFFWPSSPGPLTTLFNKMKLLNIHSYTSPNKKLMKDNYIKKIT